MAFNLSGHGHLDTPELAFRCQCDGLQGIPLRAIEGLRIPIEKVEEAMTHQLKVPAMA
jgi:hypothetical protein